jgi:hypothetical protein
LHRHAIAGPPGAAIRANRHDPSGDLAAGRAGQVERHRQAAFFQPEVQAVQPAGLHVNDRFGRRRLRIRKFPQLKSSRNAVGDELNGFHELN